MSERTMSERPIPEGAIRVELPRVRQAEDYTCGAACVLALAHYHGETAWTEPAMVGAMGFGQRGSDPDHLRAGAARCGLAVEEFRPMSDAQLRACLDDGRAVIVMLQAWGERASYVDHWTDGHWVVAIGYDDEVVYFEDPVLEDERGYLSWRELAERWHDLEGDDDHHVERYGMAVRGPRPTPATRVERARRLE